jgi:alkyl hydroperoxide reductase subunit D
MSLDALRETLPAYAKDLSLNLSSLANETVLTDQQKWGTFLASAHAVGQRSVIGAPGVDKADFELWSFAVSAINGCGMCLDSHEHELRKHGVQATQIQAALRIASVVNAVSRVIAAEKAAEG